MAPELIIAAEARRHGWNREETRVRLTLACSTLNAAEIEKELDKIHGPVQLVGMKS